MLLELVFRLFAPIDHWTRVVSVHPVPAKPTFAASVADWLGLKDGDGLLYLGAAGWRMHPYRVARYIDGKTEKIRYQAVTNRLGLRSPDLADSSAKRILFLGDDNTFGVEQQGENVFARRLERLARRDGVSLEVVNAGVPGNDLRAMASQFLEIGMPMKPEMLVLALSLDDVRACCLPPMFQPPRIVARSMIAQSFFSWVAAFRTPPFLYSQSSEYESWLKEVKRVFPAGEGDPISDQYAFNSVVQENQQSFGLAWSGSAWQKARTNIEGLAEYAAQNQIEFRIVVFPIALQVASETERYFPQQQLSRIALELDVPLLDLFPAFRRVQRAKPERSLFLNDRHLSEFGHEVTAKEMWQFLRRLEAS